MAQITLKGNTINTIGDLPAKGTLAPALVLVKTDLSEGSLADFKGKKVILNIFPSIDTGTCAMSVRQFNERAASLDNAVVLCISADLPFAQARFCGAEGIENVVMLSTFRSESFSKEYGVQIIDGPLKGLTARSIVVLDEKGTVKYTELVSETVNEPDYDAAVAAI